MFCRGSVWPYVTVRAADFRMIATLGPDESVITIRLVWQLVRWLERMTRDDYTERRTKKKADAGRQAVQARYKQTGRNGCRPTVPSHSVIPTFHVIQEVSHKTRIHGQRTPVPLYPILCTTLILLMCFSCGLLYSVHLSSTQPWRYEISTNSARSDPLH